MIMFNPEELRNIAKTKIKSTVTEVEKETVTPEIVQTLLLDLEEHVTTFASDGHMSVDYKLPEEKTVAMMLALGEAFKTKHPKMMVILAQGSKTVSVSWDGKNEV